MKAQLAKALDFLGARYLSVETRSLGWFRICFGLHLIANLYDRTQGPDGVAFYTNDGVMPNHYGLFAPLGDRLWSLLFAFSTPGEVQIAFALIFFVYVMYVVGYKTKVFQLLVIVCLLSLDNRNLSLQNGGIVVTNVVATWTAFLPLGARFSIDHLLRSLKERVEWTPAELADRAAMQISPPSVRRLAFFGIVANYACIYFFNYAHKRGVTWHDGSAVHWVLWQNRIATIWSAWLRMHEPRWLSPLATWGTLVVEAALPIWLLSPVAQKWTRRLAIAAIFGLHGSISLMCTLGPFSYSMMSFSLLLIGRDDWALVSRFFARKKPLGVFYDPSFAGHHRLARLMARLDARRAFSFADSREAAGASEEATGALSHEIPKEQRAAIVNRPFAVWDADRSTVATGSRGAACMLRALPLGPLFAWTARLPIVSTRLDRELDSPPREVLSLDDYVDVPARRFLQKVMRVSGELLCVVFFAAIACQICIDNWAIPAPYRLKERPEFVREIVEYLRVPQGWSMFSPEAPRDDGTIVIDAVLSDGRHIDPRKQKPPDFEPAFHAPWFDDQQWCDWDLRMRFDGNRHLHPHFRDYIARLDKFRSWKQDATIRYFDVYWVNNEAPPPGSTRPYNITKQLLFSGGTRP